jgi:hypothetical protein
MGGIGAEVEAAVGAGDEPYVAHAHPARAVFTGVADDGAALHDDVVVRGVAAAAEPRRHDEGDDRDRGRGETK